jgi:hypothetical protein
VDRIYTRWIAYRSASGALCFCALTLFVISLMKTAVNIGDHRLMTEVLVGVLISILTNILVVLGLSLFINRMTNKILKAIELLPKQ